MQVIWPCLGSKRLLATPSDIRTPPSPELWPCLSSTRVVDARDVSREDRVSTKTSQKPGARNKPDPEGRQVKTVLTPRPVRHYSTGTGSEARLSAVASAKKF